jgi:hypothetical protein
VNPNPVFTYIKLVLGEEDEERRMGNKLSPRY